MGDLIIIYPKPYSIYLRGTIGFSMVQPFAGFGTKGMGLSYRNNGNPDAKEHGKFNGKGEI